MWGDERSAACRVARGAWRVAKGACGGDAALWEARQRQQRGREQGRGGVVDYPRVGCGDGVETAAG